MTGKNIKVIESARRDGDPAVLVAANAKIRKVLDWTPAHDDLAFIIRTAWEWEKKKKVISCCNLRLLFDTLRSAVPRTVRMKIPSLQQFGTGQKEQSSADHLCGRQESLRPIPLSLHLRYTENLSRAPSINSAPPSPFLAIIGVPAAIPSISTMPRAS